MKYSMLSLCLATAAMMSSPAFAATYYLSDCKAGAASGCVAGSATNDGLSPSKPKQLYSQLPARQGGDRVLFAKGGSWTDASMRIFVPTASAATPVIWDSYEPTWGGTAKPILTEARAGTYLFNFDDAGKKIADGGYIIRNLDLRGGGVMGGASGGQAGIFAYWAINDLLMENLEISGFKLGVYMAHSPKTATGWENYRITLRNSYLHDNHAASFLGGAADMVIENNILDRNGYTPILDHDLYISSMTRGIIRNNTITRTTLNRDGKCAGSAIVVHGRVDGLLIENNKIVQPPAGSTPQCFGIEISGGYADSNGAEGFHDVVIRGNTVVDVGYIGVGLRSCTDCIVEGNSIIWNAASGNQGISMSVNTPSSLDERGNGLTIRNNSVYMQAASGTPTGVFLNVEGTGHTITSNVIYFGSAVAAGARCFDLKDYRAADFRSIDRNLCFRVGGRQVYSPTYATLPLAQAAGFDINGLNVDPLFVAVPSALNAYSLAVTSASPARTLGVNLKVDSIPPAAPSGVVIR